MHLRFIGPSIITVYVCRRVADAVVVRRRCPKRELYLSAVESIQEAIDVLPEMLISPRPLYAEHRDAHGHEEPKRSSPIEIVRSFLK